MLTERPDLDGIRIKERGSPNVWLVYHGRRHRIASPGAFIALFHDDAELIYHDDLATIKLGREINEGSCLVQGETSSAIYLITGFPVIKIKKHPIGSWESFLDYGFNIEKVERVKSIVLDAVPIGKEITAAKDRVRRKEAWLAEVAMNQSPP